MRCLSPTRSGNAEVEGGPFAELALDPDAAAVHLDELLGDAEPEARAAELARDGGVDLAELGEDFSSSSGAMPMPVSATR